MAHRTGRQRFTSFTGQQTREQLDLSAWMGTIAWPATVARGNLAMLGFEARQTLPEVHIPVLVIGGEKDPMTLCSAATTSRSFCLTINHYESPVLI